MYLLQIVYYYHDGCSYLYKPPSPFPLFLEDSSSTQYKTHVCNSENRIRTCVIVHLVVALNMHLGKKFFPLSKMQKKSALREGQCVDVCSKYFRDLPTIFFSKRKRVTGEEVPGDARAISKLNYVCRCKRTAKKNMGERESIKFWVGLA